MVNEVVNKISTAYIALGQAGTLLEKRDVKGAINSSSIACAFLSTARQPKLAEECEVIMALLSENKVQEAKTKLWRLMVQIKSLIPR